jgi:WXG100 family type VII secretion target
VTPEQLDGLAVQVARGSGEIERELHGLAQTLSPLGSDWAGHAQQQFQQLWSEWQSAATRLHGALDGISRLLSQAGRAYASAEQDIAATFRV